MCVIVTYKGSCFPLENFADMTQKVILHFSPTDLMTREADTCINCKQMFKDISVLIYG